MARNNLVFCTYPSLYSSLVLSSLLADETIQVKGIICSTRVLSTRYSTLRSSLEQIRLSGWRYSTYLFLVTDFFHLISQLFSVRKNRLESVFQIAKKHHIPLIKTSDINSKEGVEFVQRLAPSVLLAAHFNQRIKKPLLDLPGMDCLNIHPSLLPDYKGVDPVFYAMLNHEQQFGVTLHDMFETFDSGTIRGVRTLTRETGESLFELNCRLFTQGAELVSTIIAERRGMTTPQQGAGHYDSWPNADTVHQFRKQGNCLIRPSELLSRLFNRSKSP